MRVKPRWKRLALLLVLACLAGCASGGRAASFTPVAADEANVMLDLSNQSVERRSVTLAVYVDGRLAVRKEMASVFNSHTAHGFPESFPLRLAPGRHTIKVVAEGGVACTSTEIVVGCDTLYVGAAYFWSSGSRHEKPEPEKITLQVQDEPFGYC